MILTFLGLAVGTFALTSMGSMALHFHRMAARFGTYVQGKIFIRERTGFFGAGAISEHEIERVKQESGIAEAVPLLVSRLRSNEFIVFGLPEVVVGLPLYQIPALFGDVPLLSGRWPERSDECALGIDVAREVSGQSQNFFIYQGKRFRVSGVMARTDGPEDREVLAALPAVQKLLGRDGLVSYGILIPNPGFPVEPVVWRVAAAHPHWEILSPAFLSEQVKKSEALWDVLTVGVGVIAALVGGVGILIVMMMAVEERIPEIAVSKALGASRAQIFTLFMLESLLFSVIGSLIGFAVTLVFIRAASPFLMRQGMVLFESSAWLLVLDFGAALVLALIGGLYPAILGSQIKPSEALRR